MMDSVHWQSLCSVRQTAASREMANKGDKPPAEEGTGMMGVCMGSFLSLDLPFTLGKSSRRFV